MSRLLKQYLAVVLCLSTLEPAGLLASSAGKTERAALGSIQSHGAVRVGEILVPSQAILFAGDRVQTNNGGAMIQYRQGIRVGLGSESVADFAPARVQLERGLMNFQTASGGVEFAASTLRLEPVGARAAGNISLQGSKATVSVTEGALKVMDPSGVQLAALNAGEARLFEEAPASPASASAPSPAPAAPPQGSQSNATSSSSRKWLIGVGSGVVAGSLAVAALVRANNADDRADQANAAASSQAALVSQLQSQNAALSAQVASLRAQAAALSAQLSSLASASNQAKAIQADLAAQIAALAEIQAQLSQAQQQTTQLLAQISTQGGQATPAQLQQLQSLSSLIVTINTRLGSITTQIINDGQALNNIVIVISPTRVS
jgi:hypothetical protein